MFDLPFCSKSCSVDGALIIIPELNDGTSEGNPQKDLLERSKQINKLDNLDLFFFQRYSYVISWVLIPVSI